MVKISATDIYNYGMGIFYILSRVAAEGWNEDLFWNAFYQNDVSRKKHIGARSI